eukprot:763181-Karenia_brevis.AAC.1
MPAKRSGYSCSKQQFPNVHYALWCSESWTLTVAQKKRLRVVQRSMLRAIAGPKRQKDEEYLSWIVRATDLAEARAREAGVQCWLMSHLQSKWKWAGRILQMDSNRLAKK